MWAVTITYDADPAVEAMRHLEQELMTHDGSVSRRPRVLYADDSMVTDVTVFVDEVDPVLALQHAKKLVSEVVGDTAPIIASEVVDEELYFERADAPTLPALVSAPEVGDILDVSRQRVHQLKDTAGFPAPLYVLRSGAVWAEDAIRSFARTWERKPGPRQQPIIAAFRTT